MKKLSKLTESIWSDIQDRSAGEIGRKEDDIDLLDIKEFCEYLKTIYKTDSDNDIRVLEIEDNHQIETYLVVCLYEDESGYYRYIYYNGDYINTQLDVIETLNCRFEFERKFSTIHSTNDFDVVCIDIYPKDKARVPVTNKFFIEVLDFILDRINTPLEQKIEKITDVKESIWSDIQDRSSGETVRKEDDINHMDAYEFWEYLHDTYISQHPNRDTIDYPIDGAIAMPFFMKNDLMMYMLWIEFNNNKIECISLPDVTVSKYDGIEDVFNLEGYSGDETRICVCPKDGSEITNSFAVKVIDYLLDQAVDDKYRMFIKKERS